MTIWNENKPAPTDIPDEGLASTLTTQKTAIREGMERAMFWTDSSGLSAGQPRWTYGSVGSTARAFYDVASNASSQVSATKPLDGRLYIASDTSRFYGYTSSRTVPLGSVNATVFSNSTANAASSLNTIPSNQRFLVQIGSGTATSAAAGGSGVTTAFPTAYSTPPLIQVSGGAGSTANIGHISVQTSSTTNFTVIATVVYGAGVSVNFYWRSTGTVTL